MYTIADEHLQVAHRIAKVLVKEQERIEAGKKGIITELGKLINYLDKKIKQNISLSKEERKSLGFFLYLEQLAEHSQTIGYSENTVIYYEAINKTFNIYLKPYAKKPLLMMQILGWSQRLMHYYRNLDISNLDDEINNLQIETTEKPTVTTPKLAKPSNDIKPIAEASSTSKSPPQTPRPIPTKLKESTQTDNSSTLKRLTPPKQIKPVENTKPEKPKASEPQKPLKRPPKPPK